MRYVPPIVQPIMMPLALESQIRKAFKRKDVEAIVILNKRWFEGV